MNPKKFGSPHLDTPSSRYNFCNLATKSMKKINKENQISNRALQLGAPGLYTHGGSHMGATVNPVPRVSKAKAEAAVDRRKAHRRRGHRRRVPHSLAHLLLP